MLDFAGVDISAAELRAARRSLLTRMTMSDLQERVVSVLSHVSKTWLTELTPLAENDLTTPELVVEYSLVPLLRSIDRSMLGDLMQREHVRGVDGPELIGHIVAGNTPLVAITTAMRALLVGASSILKLPSQATNPWLETFLDHLAQTDPQIRELVSCKRWPRSDCDQTAALVSTADLTVVYGSDRTIEEISTLIDGPQILGYGHRLSVGILLSGADWKSAAAGFAKDVLLYDQQGCLSVHTIFVDGNESDAEQFAVVLSGAMLSCSVCLPMESHSRTWAIQESVDLAVMDHQAKIIARQGTRWTVIAHKTMRVHASCTHGVVYVVPAEKEGIIDNVSNAAPIIQGASLAANNSDMWIWFQHKLIAGGASRVCCPGELQQPEFSWREDCRDVLASLLPA